MKHRLFLPRPAGLGTVCPHGAGALGPRRCRLGHGSRQLLVHARPRVSLCLSKKQLQAVLRDGWQPCSHPLLLCAVGWQQLAEGAAEGSHVAGSNGVDGREGGEEALMGGWLLCQALGGIAARIAWQRPELGSHAPHHHLQSGMCLVVWRP